MTGKRRTVIFSFLMALLMSCFMSLIISIFNVGLVDNIVFIWLKAWLFAFVISYPMFVIMTPIVNKLVALIAGE